LWDRVSVGDFLSDSIESPITLDKIEDAHARLRSAAELIGYEIMPGTPLVSQEAPPLARYMPKNNPFIKNWHHEVSIELAPPRPGQTEITPVRNS